MTRFEALTQSPDVMAAYVETVIAICLGDDSMVDVERRKKWLLEEYTGKEVRINGKNSAFRV